MWWVAKAIWLVVKAIWWVVKAIWYVVKAIWWFAPAMWFRLRMLCGRNTGKIKQTAAWLIGDVRVVESSLRSKSYSRLSVVFKQTVSLHISCR